MDGVGDPDGNRDCAGTISGGAGGPPNNRVYSPGPAAGGSDCGVGVANPRQAAPSVGSIGSAGGDGGVGISNGVGAGGAGSPKKLGAWTGD
jgi:hypothetical protein